MQIPFGKHKGEDLADIPSDYLEWLLENYEPKTEREDHLLDAVLREFNYRDENDGHFREEDSYR